MDIVRKLRNIADASRREDGSDIPLGQQCREGADEIDRLRAAARRALEEMRHTVAPRNSFTDVVDELDAILNP